jgi:hypothetical protein
VEVAVAGLRALAPVGEKTLNQKKRKVVKAREDDLVILGQAQLKKVKVKLLDNIR